MDQDGSIPAPGTIVGRTRTGKPLTQPELPELPKTGQYQSVRRRTLQTSVPKPHVCQICGSRFTRYDIFEISLFRQPVKISKIFFNFLIFRYHNLKQHIKLHSGVKPYECDICAKRFTRNYTLRLHKMKVCIFPNFAQNGAIRPSRATKTKVEKGIQNRKKKFR